MGFLPASGTLWQVLASLTPLYQLNLAADAATSGPSPHAAGVPLILCELAPLNQQFLAVLTAPRQPQWPAHFKRNVPSVIKVLLLWQEAASNLAVQLIDGQQEAAQAAAAARVGGNGPGAAAGGGAGAFGTDGEQQGQGLSAVPSKGLLTSRVVMQLAASPALWAAAWAQLAAFCQGMYTWQGGKLKKSQPSSSSSSSGGRSKSSKSSTIAGSSERTGMFASLQLSPDHEQVAAVFDHGEISARIEALEIPAKGRPLSEVALAKALRYGFVAPAAFLDSVLTVHGGSVLEGLNLQQVVSGSEGTGSRAGVNRDGGGGSSTGRGDSSGEGNSSSRGGSSNSTTGAREIISRTSACSSSGEASSRSGGCLWSRGGVAPAATLQLVLEAAALLGVADGPQESSNAVMLLFRLANTCSIGPRKCLLSTRGGLLLDMFTAAARYDPGSNIAQHVHIFLGAERGAWGLGWNQGSA